MRQQHLKHRPKVDLRICKIDKDCHSKEKNCHSKGKDCHYEDKDQILLFKIYYGFK